MVGFWSVLGGFSLLGAGIAAPGFVHSQRVRANWAWALFGFGALCLATAAGLWGS